MTTQRYIDVSADKLGYVINAILEFLILRFAEADAQISEIKCKCLLQVVKK